jgi:diguanylate cyclase (GGDEF)-like protein
MALVLAIALVPLSVGLVMLKQRQNEQRRLNSSLVNQVNEQSADFESISGQARSMSRVLGDNPTLSLFYSSSANWPANRAKVESVLSFLGERVVWTGNIDATAVVAVNERCLKSTSGSAKKPGSPCTREVAHVFSGIGYTESQLAAAKPDKQKYISAVLKMPQDEVYSSEPLVSPDTGDWVLVFSNWLAPVNDKPRGIVYYELNIEAFRAAMSVITERSGISGMKGFQLAVVDRAGNVIMRSDKMQLPGEKLGVPSDKRFVSIAQKSKASGVTTITNPAGGSLRVAWLRVPTSTSDANSWTVVAVAPAKGGNLITDNPIPVALTAIALIAIAVIMGRRWVHTSAQALTDALTHLGNRRKLVADLEKQLSAADEAHPLLFALFDLDGFKNYNDSFGHPAGDAILTRLAMNLQTAMAGHGGEAYRMGGDEFCIIASIGEEGQDPVITDAHAALSERGEGFAIGSSYGTVLLPQESADVSYALRLADQRLYANKNSGRRSAGRQSADVLLQALFERSPELGDHLLGVTRFATEVGRRLGMSGEELDHLAQAAQLHDVGKMAIPDSILRKPGPLDREEWDFVRGHTVVGERIVSAAPSLAQVSRIVRSSHERYNGSGYPDGLRGEDIPLSSRIIAVADAYDAMIGARPYRLGMSKEDAEKELRRCAGAQFDPVVVDFFLSVVDEFDQEAEQIPASSS